MKSYLGRVDATPGAYIASNGAGHAPFRGENGATLELLAGVAQRSQLPQFLAKSGRD